MGSLELNPVLVYVLGVVAVTWLLRQLAADWLDRRGLSARAAVPVVARGAAALSVLLVVVSVVLSEPWTALAFGLGVVAVQAGALLLTRRLVEAERAGRLEEGAR